MTVERIQRFGARLLNKVFRISQVPDIWRRSCSLNDGESRDVWPHLQLKVPVQIARAVLSRIELGKVIAQVANQTQIATEFRERLREILVVGQLLGAGQASFRQRHCLPQPSFSVVGSV